MGAGRPLRDESSGLEVWRSLFSKVEGRPSKEGGLFKEN